MRDGFFIYIKSVCDEHKGKSCLLRLFGYVQVVVEVRTGVRRYIGTAPCIHMPARAVKRHAELYFFTAHTIPAFSELCIVLTGASASSVCSRISGSIVGRWNMNSSI